MSAPAPTHDRSGRGAIRMVRRGRIVEIADAAPTETLLDHLRLRERATGTKEGCAEGDCGACTVALGRPAAEGDDVTYRPVNACIHLTAMADGAEVVTVEDLGSGGAPHPVQAAMVEAHASQCGFCTPGFVMALFALYHSREPATADRATVNDWISGNLCRCTGYRPIVDAGLAACARTRPDGFGGPTTRALLDELGAAEPLRTGDDTRFFAAPATADALAELYLRHPDAVLVGGASDVGLWITKQLRDIPKVVHVGRVAELAGVEERTTDILIGGAATYEAAYAALSRIDPDVATVLRRFGSRQVRAVATVGGNIANASPIGDGPPVLIALGAELTLRRGNEMRTLPLEDFFLGYGRQDRQAGEFVAAIRVPKPAAGQHVRAFKVAKRFDQDISTLLGAMRFDVEGGRIAAARIAFGGMAATPKRAFACERALAGLAVGEAGDYAAALAALEDDFTPIDDHRGSAGYRMRAAKGLVAKALRELAGETGTRVHATREAADAPAG